MGARLLAPGRQRISVGSGSLGAGKPTREWTQGQSASGAQAAYVPSPPASLETGPNGPAPSANVFWSPGSWYWQENRYVWRPGFWAAVQPNWVWIPAHFVWTPGGYLFVEGYWDMPLANRGLMFAPVYYAQPVYLQPAYVYTPSITIAAPGLMANLFVQPNYGSLRFWRLLRPELRKCGYRPLVLVHLRVGTGPACL